MRTFHICLFFATPDGPVAETYTLVAYSLSILKLQIETLAYDAQEDLGWRCIVALCTRLPDENFNLALAN
jgi:hypothetical protein